jgi:hypothetical protein
MYNLQNFLVIKIKTNTDHINFQIVQMRNLFPLFEHKINVKKWGYVVFSGTLKPHINFPEYKVKIEYRLGRHPRIKIVSPTLVEKPPHYYSDTNSICLYHPNDFTWSKSVSLAETIIPWTSCWIYFYEVWKESGVWYGEEAPHNIEETKTQKD